MRINRHYVSIGKCYGLAPNHYLKFQVLRKVYVLVILNTKAWTNSPHYGPFVCWESTNHSFFVASVDKPLNNQSNDRWYEKPWCLCDVCHNLEQLIEIGFRWDPVDLINDVIIALGTKPLPEPTMTMIYDDHFANMIQNYRADSRFAPSQWKRALLCYDISHWLGASLESALKLYIKLIVA